MHGNFWSYKNDLLKTLKNSLDKGNKNATTIRKVSEIIFDHREQFLYSHEASVSSRHLKSLENQSKALKAVKSGFYQIDGFKSIINISDIIGLRTFCRTEGDKILEVCEITLSGKRTIECKEIDFDVLSIVID